MAEDDITRRKFLTTASIALGAIGAAFAAVPFIRAMSPTKDILASGRVEFDISDIKEGGLKTVIWRKQPVFILRRTPAMVSQTQETDPSTLSDPAKPEERFKQPDLFVALGICTHLGCVPKFMDKVPDTNQTGFYCPCHGGKYDSLGRRLGGPPPENLHLVPYKIETDNKIIVGTEEFGGYGENIRQISKLPQV